MIARKTLIAGAFLLSAGTAALAQGQIDADPNYQPAPQDYAGSSEPMNNRSGLPRVVGLRGSFAFSGGANTFTPTSTIKTSHGYGGGGSLYLGQRLGYGLRLDLEGMYRYLPVSKLTPAGSAPANARGSVQMAAPMLNLMWEMPADYDLPFLPFVGVGGGAAYVWNDVKDATGTSFSHAAHWSPTFNVMAGLSMPLSDSSRVSAMYRWMHLTDIGYRCANNDLCKTSLSTSSVDLSLEMDL